MSIKKELLDIVDKILKEEKAGVFLTYNENKDTRRLKHLLEQTDRWSEAVKKSSRIKILYRTSKGRRYKNLSIVVGKKLIPVTKNMIKKLGGKKDSKRTLILRKLRELIHPQMKEEKRKQLRELQRLNSKKLIPTKYHLDHVIPFIKLAVDWCKARGFKNFEDIPSRNTYGNDIIIPADIERSWQDYHLLFAELKLKPAEVNLKEGSKDYIPEF